MLSKQLCIQPPTAAGNVALLAFPADRRATVRRAAARRAAMDRYCLPAASSKPAARCCSCR